MGFILDSETGELIEILPYEVIFTIVQSFMCGYIYIDLGDCKGFFSVWENYVNHFYTNQHMIVSWSGIDLCARRGAISCV